MNKEELRSAMNRANLNKKKLASLINVDRTTVGRWLNGINPVPGYVKAWFDASYPKIMEKIDNEQN